MESLSKLLLVLLSGAIRPWVSIVMGLGIIFGLRNWSPIAILLKDSFWRWPAIIFVIGISVLVTYPLESGWKAFSATWKDWRRSRVVIARLTELTQDERHVLSQYIHDGTKTCNFGRGGGVVDLLAHDGILYLLTPNADVIASAHLETYAIAGIAWKYLNTHPELVGLEPRPVTPPQG